MALWRRKFIECFPELKYEVIDKYFGKTSIFDVLLTLQERLIIAVDNSSDGEIGKIFQFLNFCAQSPYDDMVNAVGVGFYEHIFGKIPEDKWNMVTKYIPRDIRQKYDVLMRWCLDDRSFNRINIQVSRNKNKLRT